MMEEGANVLPQAQKFDLSERPTCFVVTSRPCVCYRNAWANYYQYKGQVAYLQHLTRVGLEGSLDIVFMDMDVLVLDSISEVFCSDFGFGWTINANGYDPIDIGIQFVQRGRYSEGIEFLEVPYRPLSFDSEKLSNS